MLPSFLLSKKAIFSSVSTSPRASHRISFPTNTVPNADNSSTGTMDTSNDAGSATAAQVPASSGRSVDLGSSDLLAGHRSATRDDSFLDRLMQSQGRRIENQRAAFGHAKTEVKFV